MQKGTKPGAALDIDEVAAWLDSRTSHAWEIFERAVASSAVSLLGDGGRSCETSGSRGLALRVLHDDRLALAWLTWPTHSALEQALEIALAGAALVSPDAARSFAPAAAHDVAALACFDDAVARLRPERVAARLEPLLARGSARAGIEALHYGQEQITRRLRNSLGARFDEKSSGVSIEAITRDKGESPHLTSVLETELFYDALDPAGATERSLALAEAMARQRPPPSGAHAACLLPSACAELLAGLEHLVSAQGLVDGWSALRELRGERCAAALLSVVDDGRDVRGAAARAFDDEGTPSRRTVVIERGVFARPLFDRYFAAKLGESSTSNCRRDSHRDATRPAASNLAIEPGAATRDQLVAQMGDGLLIHELSGIEDADPATGEFAAVAEGVHVRGGRCEEGFCEVIVSGTVQGLLERVAGVGDDLSYVDRFGGVTLLIEQVDVVA